ncbi:MAG: hypothetical protein AB7I27_06375 [Bacteriovoracaceae bacterium]
MTLEKLKEEFKEAILKQSGKDFYFISPKLGIVSLKDQDLNKAYADFNEKLDVYLGQFLEDETYKDLPIKRTRLEEFKKFLIQTSFFTIVNFLSSLILIAIFIIAFFAQINKVSNSLKKEMQITLPRKEDQVKVFENKMENNRPFIRKLMSILVEEYKNAQTAEKK